MDMFQVEERGFYIRLVCNKGGVATSLCKVLESLTSFIVQTSDLASAVDGFELTVTLRVQNAYNIYLYISFNQLIFLNSFLSVEEVFHQLIKYWHVDLKRRKGYS